MHASGKEVSVKTSVVAALVSGAGALLGGLLVFGLLVAMSGRLDPHAQFIVAAGFGAPAGAIMTTVALTLASREMRHRSLSVFIGSVPGGVIGVAAGRAAIDLLGLFGVVVFPLVVGGCAYLGGTAFCRLLFCLRRLAGSGTAS